jgi:hypothetical protein
VRLTAVRHIASGEELTIHYCDPHQPVADRRRQLLEDYGFVCDCLRCMAEVEAGGEEAAGEEAAGAEADGGEPPLPGTTDEQGSGLRAEELEDACSSFLKGQLEDGRPIGRPADERDTTGLRLGGGAVTGATSPEELLAQRKAATLKIRNEKCQRGPTEWRAGETPSGVHFWSFTDGDGQPRILFAAARPELTPAEWLAAGAPKSC